MRSTRGFSIAETAASMAVMFPLLLLVFYVMVEAGYSLFLKAGLAECSREAARGLAIAYGQNPNVANNWSLEDSSVLQNVRLTNVVNNSLQFDPPQWNTTASPPTVTVTVHYKGGQYGLPAFPQPDVLKLGANFVFSAQNTYRLE